MTLATRGNPCFLRVAVVFAHRLYAVQGRDTLVRDGSYKESIVKNFVRGLICKGHIAMASMYIMHV